MIINIITLILALCLLAYVISKLIRVNSFKLKDTLFYLVYGFTCLLFFFNVSLKINLNENFLSHLYYIFTNTSKILTLSLKKDMILEISSLDVFTIINFTFLYIFPYISIVYVATLTSRIYIGNFFRKTNKFKTYVVGYNENVEEFINNSKANCKDIVVLLEDCDKTKQVVKTLYKKNIKFKVCGDVYKTLKRISFNDKEYNHIVTFSCDTKEIFTFFDFALSNIHSNNIQYLIYTDDANIKEYIEAKLSNDTVLDVSNGSIRVIYKYEQIAYDLLKNNDIAKYMPRSLIKENFTLDKCKINLFFIGFGKVNSEVFDKVVSNCHFVSFVDGKLKRKPFNIHIFDKNAKYSNMSLSNGLFKYDKSSFALEKYYELPEDIISQTKFYYNTDMFSQSLINNVYDIVNDKSSNTTVNYFFVALGEDVKNNVLASNLKKSLELINNNKKIFYVRSKQNIKFENDFIYFGNNSSVLSFDSVINDEVIIESKLESLIYSKKDVSGIDVATVEGRIKLNHEWAKLSRLKQHSNIEAILTRYFKLSLMGLDKNVSKEQYLKVYDTNGDINKEYVLKDLANSSNLTVRDIFSYIEHLRWTYFELSEGVLPRKLEKAFTTDGFKPKSENELEHLCITTQEGLMAYYNDVTRYNQINNTDYTADVICYDYDVMDNFKNLK